MSKSQIRRGRIRCGGMTGCGRAAGGRIASGAVLTFGLISWAAGPVVAQSLCSPDTDPCATGTYCEFPIGTCGSKPGICSPIPQVCPDNIDPVCGCDLNTYFNACEAAAAGVSILQTGPCGQVCGGFLGIPCDNADEFCKLPDGQCCCDISGICTPIPQVCPAIFDPVCGCDGQTYTNECIANQNGVSVDHPGPCEQACTADADTCPSGQFCQFPTGACGIGLGTCVVQPDICPLIFDPVCGCDGVTYSNACFAAAAGQSITHDGRCGGVCGGFLGIICEDPNEFCQLPDGQCCCDFTGECLPIPQICPDVFDPVCGCDGVTYGNECEANMAGQSVNYEGPCQVICAANSDCEEGEYCLFPIGTCGLTTTGVCEPIGPPICPLIFDPVCGCDGVTYSNACFAAAAGQSIAHDGPCEEVCGGFIGIQCQDPNDFCLLPDGMCCCDIQGVCTPIPQACPDVFDPVCGCDGVTYANECDANANSVSVDHPGFCPVAIIDANPPTDNPFVPGAQPFRDVLHDVTVTPAPIPQGIGAPTTPPQGTVTYDVVSVTFSGVTGFMAAQVSVACTDIKANGPLDCPVVTSVSPAHATNMFTLTLSSVVPSRECTTLTFPNTVAGQKLQYSYLPADVNFSGTSSATDLSALVLAIGNGTAANPMNLPRYNINRAGPVGAADVLRLVQLLNGVLTTQVWAGVSAAACP